MNTKLRIPGIWLLIVSGFISGCAMGPNPTLTPTPTSVPTSTLTPTQTPLPTAIPTSTPEPTLEGTWTGTTSEDLAISFTVADNTIRSLKVGYRVEGATCTVDTDSEFGPGSLALIEDSKFRLELTSGVIYIVTGSFSDFNSASGEIEFSGQDFLCGRFTTSATWRATK